RLVATGHPDSRIVELGDVQACVVPTTPGASIPNGVVYEDAGVLADALRDGRLAEVYGDLPFLVWLRPGDDRAAAACGAAGLKLDGHPTLMAAPLAEIGAPRGGVEVTAGSWGEVAGLYALPVEMLLGIADPAARIYAVPGAAVAVTLDVGAN